LENARVYNTKSGAQRGKKICPSEIKMESSNKFEVR